MPDKNPVAIIGMGCLFPRSQDLKDYWQLLYHGKDAITDIPESHWSPSDYFDDDPKSPDRVYCKRGGFLSPIDFDPSEFGIPPTSLEATDTSQLLGLFAAKMALADCGYTEQHDFDRDRTAVILGVTGTQELVIPLSSRLGFPKWRKALEEAAVDPQKAREVIQRISDSYIPWQESSFPGLLGNVVAGRISNRLDLRGTNCVVDAACASSLSAIHLAMLELQSGKSDMVVTGGVDTLNDIFMHMCFAKTRALSASGNARPFSRDADGTVLGEGIGILVLKRLSEAEKDGNRIYAVIKGLGSSSDGKSQSIYSPRKQGQVKALRAAYESAGINPATIGLIEAHGTGTRVGDKVEFEALNQVFEEYGANGHKSALGSVKSMIGHTKASAGAAGLIKAALGLYHKVLPPTLKAETPDPGLNIENSHFYLNRSTRPWFSPNGDPRRAGVSAFGFGGSNFHVVLEEYQAEKSEIAWDGSVDIIAFSADSRSQLAQHARHYQRQAARCLSHREPGILAAQSRKHFSAADPYRLLIVCDQDTGLSDLLDRALAALASGDVNQKLKSDNICFGGPEPAGKLAFVFPGQGSQYLNMGRDLVCTFPQAMQILQRANRKFDHGALLTDRIFPPADYSEQEQRRQQAALQNTAVAQPAIGAVSLAMLKVLQSFGVTPAATCGHSFGELTALCAAGWIDEDTLLELAITRGRLMADAGGNQDQSAGTMLAVQAPLDELEKLLIDADPGVVLANRNSPTQGVFSGPTAAIAEIEKICKQQKINAIRLPVSAAFHSELVNKAGRPFQRALEAVTVNPTAINVFSNTTGEAYPADEGAVRSLLGHHLTRPVDFVREIENMHAAGVTTFVEIGPKSILTGLIANILQDGEANAWALDPSAGKRYGITDLARLLGHLAASGFAVDLTQWEKSDASVRKSRMNILLSGTNYVRQKPDGRNQQTEDPPSPKGYVAAGEKPAFADGAPAGSQKTEEMKATVPLSDYHQRSPLSKPSKPANEYNSHMSKDNNKPSTFIQDALKVVQEGLKSMQHLQSQTAAAHQKFLEAQTEANRSLQAMMQNTQRLAEQTLDLDSKPLQPVTVQPLQTDIQPEIELRENIGTPADTDNFSDPSNPSLTDSSPLEPTGTVREKLSDMTANGYAQAPENRNDGPENQQRSSQVQQSIQATLLTVVSQLTGYPTEMLGLDMDIEAELGIDSIKRVEILSTLEEKMPDLPAVSPEIMGSLKTLGQIVEYLAATGNAGGETDKASGANTADDNDATGQRPAAGFDQPPEIQATLLAVVSQLTGYPTEMLGLDMDIEAELGIDSIKRVEILSTLEEKMPDLPAVAPEIMGSLKTLGQIVEYLSESTDGSVCPQTAIEPAPEHDSSAGVDVATNQPDHRRPSRPQIQTTAIPRNVVSIRKSAGATAPLHTLAANRKVFITEDNTGLSEQIAEELTRLEIGTIRVSLDILKYKKQLPAAAGLIIVQDPASVSVDQDLKDAFALARYLAPGLVESAEQGGAIFATVTRMDGAFGLKGGPIPQPIQGGLAGLVKTAAIEWPNVCCHAIDIAADWSDKRLIAKAVVAEVLTSGAVEVGFDSDQRHTVTLQPEPCPEGHLNLTSGDVVVISGGARGITAAAALGLARETALTLVLLGRSPHPVGEPAWLSGLDESAAIKKAILENEFKGQKPTPVEVETAFKGHMAKREIAANLAELKLTGAEAYYYETDIRDVTMVQNVMAEIRNLHGPIAGIIHGAGVLEDRLIIDKTIDQFERVFDTKVKGLENLLAAAGHDQLKYLILFSSVAARMGNKGQSDYAMANEVLNKMALNEAAKRPDCRVVAINWGPWEGGMVSASLKREFERQGIHLIPIDSGVRCMLDEMRVGKGHAVEVVIGAEIGDTGGSREIKRPELVKTPPEMKKQQLSLSFERDIGVSHYPILKSHVIDGKPVVPMALMTEWFAHGALHANPGLVLHGLDDIRILKGIRLESDKKHIRLLAGRPRKKGNYYEVPVELRDGQEAGRDIIHSSARAILGDRLPSTPSYRFSKTMVAKAYAKKAEDVYDKILFHGDQLHGIRKIVSCSSRGMVAHISPAPAPDQWIAAPLRNQWIGDPLVLDSAFQMASVWCFEEKGIVSLPSYAASYRQYRAKFPSEGVTAVLEIKEATDRKMCGDFIFLNADDKIVARIEGFEAIMDPALFKAFKPQLKASA